MTTSVRAHHLLCLLTYVGKGYSERFVATMTDVAERLGAGEPFTLTDGPDSICAGLDPESEDSAHCAAERNRARDAIALRHVEEALGHPLGTTLSAEELDTLRSAYAEMRESCFGCEWHSLCDDVSAAGFPDTKLLQLRITSSSAR